VDWKPGRGRKRHLLGYVDEPEVRFCDFRRAACIYVLWTPYRAIYVGMARGREGLFDRLSDHAEGAREKRDWTRFSWYSIDAVTDSDVGGWCETEPRLDFSLSDDTAVRDIEALMIVTLGSFEAKHQNRMKFLNAQEWFQSSVADFGPDGLAREVDPSPFSGETFEFWGREGDPHPDW
jgi:hypothetical protein